MRRPGGVNESDGPALRHCDKMEAVRCGPDNETVAEAGWRRNP